MKKKILFFTAVIVLGLTISLSVGCSENSQFSDIYYAHYGEWYTLPAADSITVTLAGENVAVTSNRVFIDNISDYTLKIKSGNKNQTSTLKVINNKKPLITVKKEVMYGTVNKKAELIDAVANDGVSNLSVTKKMFKGETEIDITSGFIPLSTGEYTYVLSAGSGKNTAKKEIPYYIEENDDLYKNKISSFDKPYGVKQAGYTDARSAYSTDMRFEDEDGSLELQLNPKLTANSYEFILTNLNEPDVTKFDAIYFYAYNDTNVSISLWFNWSTEFVLKSKTWTRIEITKSQYESVLLSSTYPSIKDSLTLNNINGLNLNVNHSHLDMVLRDDCVYFSAMYGLKTKTVGEIKDEITEISQKGSVTASRADNLTFYYSQLSGINQKKVTNYNVLQEMVINQELEKAGVIKVADKIMYFDEDAGASQINLNFGVSSYEISDEKLYDNGKTLKLTKDSQFDLGIKFIRPFIYDISSYDALSFAVYNGFHDDLIVYNTDTTVKNIGSGVGDYVLKANSWNRILIPVGDAVDIVNSMFWIRPSDWSYPGGITKGTEFFVSPVYGVDFNELIDSFDSSDYADSGYVENIFLMYNSLSAAKKSQITGYAGFAAGYIDYIDSDNKLGPNTVIGFDSEIGLKQIRDLFTRTTLSYTADRKYGSEEGSTKLVNNTTSDIDISITVPAIIGFTGTETLKMYIYCENPSTEYYAYFNAGDYALNCTTKLYGGQWNELSIPLSSLGNPSSIQGCMLMIMNKDWKAVSGDIFYLSALKVA